MLFPGLPSEQSAISQMTLTLSCKMTSAHSVFVSLMGCVAAVVSTS